MKILLLFLITALISCSTTKNQQRREQHYERIHGLTKQPKYLNAEIKSQRGDTVRLKGIAGLYILENGNLTRIKRNR